MSSHPTTDNNNVEPRQFIVLDTPLLDAEAKRNVRQHVMRAHHRQRRRVDRANLRLPIQPKVRSLKAAHEAPETGNIDATHSLRTAVHPGLSGCNRSLKAGPETSAIDPFNSLPAPNNGSVQLLLHHYITAMKMHLGGLELLVKNRGGLEKLGWSGMAARLISWIDSSISIALDAPPVFDLIDYDLDDAEPPSLWSQYSLLALHYKDTLFDLTALREESDEMIYIYWGIKNLFELKQIVLAQRGRVEIVSYSAMLDRLQRGLVRLIQSKPLTPPFGNRDCSIFRLFGYAAIIHIYFFMRDFPRGIPFFHMLTSRVRQLLEISDVPKLQEHFPQMMLWIVMMGGLGGIRSPNSQWFATLVAGSCDELKLNGGNEVSSMLKDFLWSDLYRSPVTRGFWEEVATAQGRHGAYETIQLPDNVSMATFNIPT
ncbi:hypothetical protein BP6252_06684 [Coleophoma cylindrospora]|uniref:Transcription factor domain-containing protein n=1 Tax=Coleophoma cylindrospora TaxID=1849047 RepID=A0A3D8RN69_9HELO|nr:hypothetical protein BP6252_06684 [Coleophoma cylindrospora]